MPGRSSFDNDPWAPSLPLTLLSPWQEEMPVSWESKAFWEVSLDKKKENTEFLQCRTWTFLPGSQTLFSSHRKLFTSWDMTQSSSTYLAHTRPWVLPPLPKQQKKKCHNALGLQSLP